MVMSDSAILPLLTPKFLDQEREDIARHSRPWCASPSLVDPDLDSAADMVVFGIHATQQRGISTKTSNRDKNGGSWSLTVSDFALCLELTRYGNSLAANTNGKAGDENALFYLKMTFAGAAKDNLPVARLVVGAGANESVIQRRKGQDSPAFLTRNLHPAHLQREGAGKPEKDARSVAIGHAQECATKAGLAEAGVRAYVANLYSLFHYHDGLYGITHWEFWPALATV